MKKEFKGKGGEEKKSLLLALNWSGYFAGLPVSERGGGGWRDWFHFSLFLSHTLPCCSASSPVPQGPSAPR